jgi:hypothetical protein
MAQFTFDEREIEQLWVAAHELGTKLGKSRKEAINLRYAAPALAEIDEQIRRNMHLRTILNPQAEKEAREAARRKRGERPRDPRQIDIEHEITATAEPNGKRGKRAKKVSTATVVDGLDVANPEATQETTDELLSQRLWEVCGLTIGADVVHKWTSSEREQADKFVTTTQLRAAMITSGQAAGAPPEPPHCVWNEMWRKRYQFNPRGSTLMESAPAKEREYWADAGPFTIRKDGGGSQSKFFVGGILDGELQELEITDKRGLSRFRDAAIARSAQLNRSYAGRLLVGGEKFAADWVVRSMRHPGQGARYVKPTSTSAGDTPNATEAQ